MGGDHRLLELMRVRVDVSEMVLFIGALYHPTRPIYDIVLERVERTVEELGQTEPDALLILGLDLNQLGDGQTVEATGLVSLVHQWRRGPRQAACLRALLRYGYN